MAGGQVIRPVPLRRGRRLRHLRSREGPNGPVSLIAATQFTAIATGVLAAGAIITAIFAIMAFRTQSQEVGLLLKQAVREAEDRRRAQAAKVFVAVGGLTPDMADEVRMHNSSDQPIYDLAVSWADGAELQRVPHLMPGREYPFLPPPQRMPTYLRSPGSTSATPQVCAGEQPPGGSSRDRCSRRPVAGVAAGASGPAAGGPGHCEAPVPPSLGGHGASAYWLHPATPDAGRASPAVARSWHRPFEGKGKSPSWSRMPGTSSGSFWPQHAQTRPPASGSSLICSPGCHLAPHTEQFPGSAATVHGPPRQPS